MRLTAAPVVLAALGAVASLACANLGSPPGGPVRTEPPVVELVTPDSGAVNFDGRSVTFHFDAVVADRDIENFFLISPRDGEPRVRWRRNRVEVRPGRDFRPNTAYSVTQLPGIADLNGNTLRDAKTIVFSTGPAIPRTTITGRVFDWANERIAPNARVEATRLPDSLLYVGVADSAGQFVLGPLDDGTYVVRAVMDNNRNRDADPGEPSDSAQTIVQGASPVLELLALVRDTVGPGLQVVSASDSVTITASFDRPIQPGQPFDSAFRVQRQDSTLLRVIRVLTRAQRDSAARTRADSADTTRRVPPVDPRVDALTAQLPGRAATPRPSRPAPPTELTLILDPATPLQASASYRVTAVAVRGINGRTREMSRVIQGPAPRDTTRVSTPPPNN